MYEFDHRDIVGVGIGAHMIAGQVSLREINDKAGDLRLQYVEVIRDEDEENANAQTDAVLPEIFIDGPELLHPAKVREVEVR